MSVIRTLVQVSLLAACGATSFVSAQVYMAAKEEALAEMSVKAMQPTVTSSDSGNEAKPLSPVIPTAKYAVSALAMPKTPAVSPTSINKHKVIAAQATKPAKKVAAIRHAKSAPMQLASFPQPEQPRAYGYAYGYASEPERRASSLFGPFH
jgi:hypothetical protein